MRSVFTEIQESMLAIGSSSPNNLRVEGAETLPTYCATQKDITEIVRVDGGVKADSSEMSERAVLSGSPISNKLHWTSISQLLDPECESPTTYPGLHRPESDDSCATELSSPGSVLELTGCLLDPEQLNCLVHLCGGLHICDALAQRWGVHKCTTIAHKAYVGAQLIRDMEGLMTRVASTVIRRFSLQLGIPDGHVHIAVRSNCQGDDDALQDEDEDILMSIWTVEKMQSRLEDVRDAVLHREKADGDVLPAETFFELLEDHPGSSPSSRGVHLSPGTKHLDNTKISSVTMQAVRQLDRFSEAMENQMREIGRLKVALQEKIESARWANPERNAEPECEGSAAQRESLGCNEHLDASGVDLVPKTETTLPIESTNGVAPASSVVASLIETQPLGPAAFSSACSELSSTSPTLVRMLTPSAFPVEIHQAHSSDDPNARDLVIHRAPTLWTANDAMRDSATTPACVHSMRPLSPPQCMSLDAVYSTQMNGMISFARDHSFDKILRGVDSPSSHSSLPPLTPERTRKIGTGLRDASGSRTIFLSDSGAHTFT
eukprot:GEMP01018899.1.p1 GENE.GEMP01018899.1~~GEMP01018899.1.p1  ORF type:complete len:549 (+),score=120.63 GEMP01018899.1:131-1777(+)